MNLIIKRGEIMATQSKNIIVLGGGYGGVMAALRLAHRTKRLDATITLVNALDQFVDRPLLHEQATGPAPRPRPIAQMLRGTKARFLQGWVTAIDPAQQSIEAETSGGRQRLAYDYLVIGLGSRVNRQAVPGAQEHAFSLDPYGDLTTAALKSKLSELDKSRFRVVVVGGGATGIEAACEVKGRYPQSEVAIVTQGQVGAFKGERVRKYILEELDAQSIAIHEYARVNRVGPSDVELDSGQMPADLVIWAGGFVASPLGRAAGLPVNTQNQVLVDPYLRSLAYPNIYAVGDAACPVEAPGVPMRMSLYTALISGAQAAENIAAELQGKPAQPLSFVWYGQGIALGPAAAVGFGTYPADRAWPLIFRGKLAVKLRSFFVWYLGSVFELERRLPGSFIWTGKQRYAQKKQRQPVTAPSWKLNLD
jgi:NADH dehydrogenase FAD-containing subunit